MSGQKSSKNKAKTTLTKRTSVSRAKKQTKNASSRATNSYAAEQNKSSWKIIAFIAAIIVIVGGIFIYNRVKLAKEVNDGLKTVVETGKSLEEASKTKASEGGSASSATGTVDVQAYKEVLDEYMDFMEEYVAFMKKYKNASTSEMASMMKDYTTLLNKEMEWAKKIDGLDDKLKGELSEEDYAEFIKAYTDVVARATKLISDLN